MPIDDRLVGTMHKARDEATAKDDACTTTHGWELLVAAEPHEGTCAAQCMGGAVDECG